MSVFTPLQQDEISEFLSDYRLGDLVSHHSLSAAPSTSCLFLSNYWNCFTSKACLCPMHCPTAMASEFIN